MRLVIDTNTLISGSLWQGPPARLLEAAAQRRVELILTPDLLGEFASVANRPKFASRLSTIGMTANALARKLAEEVTIVAPASIEMQRVSAIRKTCQFSRARRPLPPTLL